MPWWVTAPLVLLALVLVDRALLAAERRRWIYYRRAPSRRPTAGQALLNIEAIFRPEVQHVAEHRAAIGTDSDEDGEPPHR